MKFKIGQIIFFNNETFYGELIQLYNLIKFGQKGYVHVGIITKVEKNRVLIHEAISKGFVKSWYPKYWIINRINSEIIDIKQPKLKITNIYKNTEKYLGRPYAWYDIFGIVLSFLFDWKFIKITGAKQLICSEAVARILYDSSQKKINFELEYNKPYDMISPQEIYMSKFLKN